MKMSRLTTWKLTIIKVAFVLLLPCVLWGANIYVDGALGDDITNGSYSIANRDGSGSDGNAYNTVQEAFTAMSGGDDIYIRGGTYTEQVIIPSNKSGSAENRSTVQSYPGEWAIIDNNHQASPALTGYDGVIHGVYGSTQYWTFERLELTGGGVSDASSLRGAGLYLEDCHYVIMRYLYIHDNWSQTQTEGAAAGIVLRNDGAGCSDNIIEYCYLIGNGDPTGDSAALNSANGNIAIYADYKYENTVDLSTCTARNIIRYNLMDGKEGETVVGFMHKAWQRLTGANYGEAENVADNLPNDASGNDDGDKIHHNIILNHYLGMRVDQDYVQVYNNIIWNTVCNEANDEPFAGGIHSRDYDSNRRGPFNLCVYNNTIYAASDKGIHISLIENDWNSSDLPAYFDDVWVYNNIIDSGGNADDWSVISIESDEDTHPTSYTPALMHTSRNFMYRPVADDIIYINLTKYTAGEVAATDSADYVWGKESPSPFAGASGADKYKATGSYPLDETYTIANGGIGGNHPYLSGVTIPSYVGAVNPSDTSWVAGVLALDASYMTSATAGSDPSWIEGSGSSSPTTHRVSSGVTRRGVGIH